MNIRGHHHISIYTKDAQRNKAFYTEILGLRLVEKTVNQDNTSMYHLFFGDETGSPGTLLTYFEIPNVGQPKRGTDSIYRFSLLIPDNESLEYFKKRLTQHDVEWNELTYLNQPAISFEDVDGVEVILLVNDNYEMPHEWQGNSYSDIPEQYQILGMGPVELRLRDAQATIDFLKNVLEYEERQDFNETVMTLDKKGLYTDFVVKEEQGDRARQAQGYIHHIAVKTPTDDDLKEIFERIDAEPRNNSGIIDRYFFRSLYYRQNGILYDFATEEPGFTVDTPKEELGNKLNLPEFLEPKREEIESKLKEL